jgi:hypothetical protein
MQDFYDAIKNLAAGEVYALVAAQDAQYPAIVYTPIVQEHIFGLDGPHGLQRVRMQVDTYARTYQEAFLRRFWRTKAPSPMCEWGSQILKIRPGCTG